MLNQVLRQFPLSILSSRGTVTALISLALSAVFGASAFAASTLNVPAQYATIQAAITAASIGDTVLVADGTYTGAGNVNLDFGGKDITVTSVNGAANTIIDCQGSAANPARGFYFQSGETAAAKIDGLTIKNGNENPGGGAINVLNGSPTIINCAFTRNFGGYGGGGAIYLSYSKSIISNCSFASNFSKNWDTGGGGIRSEGGEPIISNCTFTNNFVIGGIGGAVEGYDSNLSILNCSFQGNATSGDGISGGGAIYVFGGALTLTNCTLANSMAFQGGGVYLNFTTFIATNCIFKANTAITSGGGLSATSVYGVCEIINCIFTENVAWNGTGGAICNDVSSGPVITNCILYNDTGGEIYTTYNGGVPAVTYSDLQGGFAGTGNIDAVPQFVNVKFGDFCLQTSSPCIGKGTPDGAPTTDANGNPRPDPPSMGAYEVATIASGPRLTSFRPTSGNIGTMVSINGSGFTVASLVKFGNIPSQTITVVSSSEITATVPPGVTTGRISITTSNGATTSAAFFAVSDGATLNVPTQYGTIQAAIDAAIPDDIVMVANGTYTGPGNTNLNFSGKNIAVISANGPLYTIIDCMGAPGSQSSGFYFSNSEMPNAKVSGFTIKNGYTLYGGAGIGVTESSPTISNCIFTNNIGSNYSGAIDIWYSKSVIDHCSFTNNSCQSNGSGAIYTKHDDLTISNCVFRNNSTPNGSGGGIGIETMSTATVANCTFSNNTANNGGGIYVNDSNTIVTNCVFRGNSATRGGSIYSDTITAAIMNCTFYGNFSNIDGGGIYVNSGNPLITNCILYGDSGLHEIAVGATYGHPIVSYSDVQGGYGGSGNINTDPLFVNSAADDFHLQSASPCIGTGTAIGAPSTDADGSTRPNPPSIGAYEVGYGTPAGLLDFNSDGKPDLILQNTTSNKVALWYMNNAAVIGGAYVSPTPPAGWKVVSEGDFNGDGRPDVVMQNSSTNKVALWYLNGASLISGAYLATMPAAGWKVVGSGDFNGDGNRDLVLQNTATGKVAIWYLNGTTVTSGAYVSTTPPTGWYVVACGDFNGDGKPDIALQNVNTRQIAIWYLNGTSLITGGYVSITPSAGWSVAGSGDFNGDGKRDLVLQHSSTNQAALWYLNGLTVTGGAYTSITPGAGWKVVGPR